MHFVIQSTRRCQVRPSVQTNVTVTSKIRHPQRQNPKSRSLHRVHRNTDAIGKCPRMARKSDAHHGTRMIVRPRRKSQIFGAEAGMFCDPGQHFQTDLDGVVEGPNVGAAVGSGPPSRGNLFET